MAITIIKQVPIIIASGNDAVIKVSYASAFSSSGVISSVSITPTSGISAGSSFNLIINDVTYTFTYAATPVLTDRQYSTDLFACLSVTAVLVRYFVVTKAGNTIYLTTRSGEIPSIELGDCTNIVLTFNKSYSGMPKIAENSRWLLGLQKNGSSKLIGPIESLPSATGNGFTGEISFNVSLLLPKSRRGFYNFPNTAKMFLHSILEKYTPQVFLQQNIPAVLKDYVAGTTFYCLPGKLSETRLASMNSASKSFADVLNSSKMFLSWRNISRQTDIYSPQKLYFIAQSAGTYVLKVQKWYVDGSAPVIEQLATISAAAYQTIEVCCAWSDVRTVNDNAALRDYEVWIEKAGIAVSEKRHFEIDYNYYQFARYWLYRNSLGAYDIIRTTGKAKQVLDVVKSISRVSLPNDFTEQNASTRQLSDSASIKYNINTGYEEAALSIEYQEFLRSGEVYWIRSGTLAPVQVSAKAYDILTDDDDFPFLEFEVELAQSDDYMVAAQPLLPIDIGDFDDDFNDDYLS
jgi:hypothetical protein